MPHSGTGKRAELQPLLEPIFLGAWSCLTPALPSAQGSTPVASLKGSQPRHRRGELSVESCSSAPSGRPQLQVREHQIPNLILEEWPRLQTARRQSPGRALNFQLSHLGKGVRVGAGQAACGGTAPVRCTALQGCEPAPSPERTGRPGWAAELRSPGDHEQLDFPRSTVASLPGEARRRQRWCPLGEPEPPEAPEESGVAKTGRSCWSGPLTPDPRPPG